MIELCGSPAAPTPRPAAGPHHHGWALWHLVAMEAVLWGRWPWWLECLRAKSIGTPATRPIPQIPFFRSRVTDRVPDELTDRLAHRLDMLAMLGGFADAKERFLGAFRKAMKDGACDLAALVDWWLWSFGSPSVKERPAVSEAAADVLYRGVQLHRLLGHPEDWGAELGAAFIRKKDRDATSWFPTPLFMATYLVESCFQTLGTEHTLPSGLVVPRDPRTAKVFEPCVGTGAFLLAASNHTLVMRGIDIDPLMLKLCEFNCWLFVPWVVAPAPWLRDEWEADGQAAAPAEAPEPVQRMLFPELEDPHA